MSQRTVLQLNPLNRAFHSDTHVFPSLSTTRSLRMLSLCFVLGLTMFVSSNADAEQAQRGPDVVIIAGEDKVVYEFRQNGELRMVRVVPKWGKPYYLVPRDGTKGFGNLERADMLLPQWVIAEF